jgi:hypothetical protein
MGISGRGVWWRWWEVLGLLATWWVVVRIVTALRDKGVGNMCCSGCCGVGRLRV